MSHVSAQQNRRLRVVLLARSLEVGGAEVQLTSLARGLDRSAFDVSVACFYAHGRLLDELESARIPVVPLGKRGRWDLVGFMPRFVTNLRQLEPDILHTFLGPPNILAAVARPWLRGSRVIWGVRASNMDLNHYDWSWRITSLLERVLARRADRIVANSCAGRDFAIAGGLPSERMTVISNGIDTSRFKLESSQRNALRSEWGIPDDAFLIGKVARLDPMKDHRTFLRAAAQAVAQDSHMYFVCVGEGPDAYAEALRREAEALGLNGRVLWVGARKDMPAVFGAFDAATLTSAFGEGFPNAVGEAMACERACVVTDVGDSARIVADTGITAKPGDAEAIAQGWQMLADETPAQRISRGSRCRARIVDAFSSAAMIDAHAALYRKIADMSTSAVT